MRKKYLEYLLDDYQNMKGCFSCKYGKMGIFMDKCKYLGFAPEQDYICNQYRPSWKILKILINEDIRKGKLLTKESVNYRKS